MKARFATGVAVLGLLALGLGGFGAGAQGRAVGVFIVVPDAPGKAGPALERMELDAAMAAFASGGRAERAGGAWRWSASGMAPYRALGRSELARRPGWILLRVDLEPGRAAAPLPKGKDRKVSFTLDELVAAPFGTRSPELHAVFLAAKAAGLAGAGARVVSMKWDERRARFEATVRLAR